MSKYRYISVSDAAKELGIIPSRVRALISAGLLEAEKIGNRWLVSRTSVERRLRNRTSAGRSFTPRHAWALLLHLAGSDRILRALPGPEQSRIRQTRRLVNIVDLVPRLRRRAETSRLRVHSNDVAMLSNEKAIVLSGVSVTNACHFDIVAPGVVEFYATPATIIHLSQIYFLEKSNQPNVIAHVVKDSWPFLPCDRVAPCLIAAVDLLGADDERTRRAGRAYLQNQRD